MLWKEVAVSHGKASLRSVLSTESWRKRRSVFRRRWRKGILGRGTGRRRAPEAAAPCASVKLGVAIGQPRRGEQEVTSEREQ